MSHEHPTVDHSPQPRFDSTQWSLVMTAQHRSSAEGQVAFATLCEKYWYPLYAYVRQREQDVHHARDLTQGFFEKVVEKNYIADVDPNRGRFRTFLITSLTNFMANEWNKQQTIKRGGNRIHFSLDFDEGDRRFAHDPADTITPELQYERRWALALLAEVLRQLKAEYFAARKGATFTELQQFLTLGATTKYAIVGKRLDMTEGAVKVAVHRLRVRYREMLRDEIAATISNIAEVDDEIRRLFETFST